MSPSSSLQTILIAMMIGTGLFGNLSHAQNGPALESLRLEDALAQATQTFQAGDYPQAATLFSQLEETFGREPELRDPSVQRIILPAWGYSEFASRNYTDAILHLNAFLEQFPERGSVHAFALYTLAQAEQFAGDDKAAAARYGEFVSTYPGARETPLAALQQADLLFRMGETEQALALADALYESDASETLRTQARLRALQEFIDQGEFSAAADLLLNTPWQIRKMPELAVLAFAALQTGDALMMSENFPDALRCYRFVPPYHHLLERQRNELLRARRALATYQRNATGTMASAWTSFYAGLVARLESQLEALETMGDYTPGYLLRYGQAFLSNSRGREALLLFRDLANDETLPTDIRQQAHYRWILSDFFLRNWERTLAVAIDFEERYPESELAPDALYLVAQAYQEQGKYRQAIEVYDELLNRFPANDLAPRWLFTRGFNLSMLEQYERAREDFTQFGEDYGKHPLATKARLWHALTHHFEGNYDKALAELDPLAEDSQDHYLYPEIRYRMITAHYALQDYDTARTGIDQFLETYPLHPRAPEAVVLRGDILMGQGELIAASAAFAEVSPEAGSLFPYAVFQRGKIFKALERYDLMIEHFNEYLDREDLTERPRMSEALYWLGWAHLRDGDPAKALARFDQALEEFGNDPSATEIQALIASLESIRNELLRADLPQLPDHPVLDADSFSVWIEDETGKALADRRLTWFSRLKLFQANQEKVRGNEEMARILLQEIDQEVPMEQLDPEVIAEIGLIFADAGFGYAQDYFDFVLENYPQHPARATAWFGKAQKYLADEELEEADDLLRKFEQQFPLHPLAPRVQILRGRILTQLGYFDDAEKTLEDVLRRKDARGRPHARALAGLAELNEQRDDPQRAIAYWQRIYTLYRAYPELVGEAYYRSALLFEEIGDPIAAFRSLEEMLSEENLQTTRDAAKAEVLRSRLLEKHGPFSKETKESDKAEPPTDSSPAAMEDAS